MLRVPAVTVTCLDEAERALLRMSEIGRTIAELKAAADVRIEAIKEELRPQLQALALEAESLSSAIEPWAGHQRQSWGGKRSQSLTHGRVGWRKHPDKIKPIVSEAELLGRLAVLKLDDCIRRYEEPDLNKLAALDDQTLTDLGCKRVQAETFFAEPSKPTKGVDR